jgi:hypothetical protein
MTAQDFFNYVEDKFGKNKVMIKKKENGYWAINIALDWGKLIINYMVQLGGPELKTVMHFCKVAIKTDFARIESKPPEQIWEQVIEMLQEFQSLNQHVLNIK